MSRPRASPVLFLLPLLLVAACSHRAAVRAPELPVLATGVTSYAVVHVDHLQAGGLGPFAAARKRWVDVLAKGGTTDGRGLYVQTGDSGFLSLRPLGSLGDLDRSPALVKAALGPIDPAAQKAYDDASDSLLAPPHRNEIWRFDPDESFGVNDPIAALSSAAWGKMTVEEIDPTPKGEVYETAWKEISRALASEDYPLVRVAYFSRYGSGDLVSFWLAKSQREFLETKSVEATVAHALGEEAAQKLFDQQRKAVVASESVDVIPRPDLSTRPL
jgi:hypothetical protein